MAKIKCLLILFLSVQICLFQACKTVDGAPKSSAKPSAFVPKAQKCTLTIVPGTIIRYFGNERVKWDGNPWHGGTLTKVIPSGTHRLIAEAEFDFNPPAGSSAKYKKIHVYDRQFFPQENGNPDRGIFVSNLSRTFTFLPNHRYHAQIVLNARNEYMLYIWDENDFPSY
jgi:hypothetical protein